MMLKETGTATEGIFRVSGANRRINQLQEVFDSPPRYGKDLDWEGYSVHDAASVLRRFLNMMPEPVIPENLYRDFTAVLRTSFSNRSVHKLTVVPQKNRTRSRNQSPRTAPSSPVCRPRHAISSSTCSTFSPSLHAAPTRTS